MEFALYRFLRYILGSDHIPVYRHGLSHIETYEVLEEDLARLESEGSDVGFDFQIAQACFTVAVSILVTLVTNPPPDANQKTFTVFVVVVVVGFLGAFVFGFKWYKNRNAFSRTLQKIRDQRVGPVGVASKELRLSELAQMPAQQPSITQQDQPE